MSACGPQTEVPTHCHTGRNICDCCRYLALVAALACEADFVFVPEYPHNEGWEGKLCKKLQSVCINFLNCVIAYHTHFLNTVNTDRICSIG